MITTLRSFYDLEAEKKDYYISGAPQCVVPDAHLAKAISNSWFDFIFVQFYNTPQCSARAHLDSTYGSYGGAPTDISFDAWAAFIVSSSFNPNAKLYLGLPASPDKTYDPYMYLQPAEASKIITDFQCKYPTIFGGAMLYEATASEANSVAGVSYSDAVKGYLKDSSCAVKLSTSSAIPSSTSGPTSLTSSAGVSTNSSTSSTSGFSSLTSSVSSVSASSIVSSSTFVSGPSTSSTSTLSTIPIFSSLAVSSSTSSVGNSTLSSSLHQSPTLSNSTTVAVPSTSAQVTHSSLVSGGVSSYTTRFRSSYDMWNVTSTAGPTASGSQGTSSPSGSAITHSPSVPIYHNATATSIVRNSTCDDISSYTTRTRSSYCMWNLTSTAGPIVSGSQGTSSSSGSAITHSPSVPIHHSATITSIVRNSTFDDVFSYTNFPLSSHSVLNLIPTADHTASGSLETGSTPGPTPTQSSSIPDYHSAGPTGTAKTYTVSLTLSRPASSVMTNYPDAPAGSHSSAYRRPTSEVQLSSESGKSSTKTRDSEGTPSQITHQSSALLLHEITSGAEASPLSTKGESEFTSTKIASALTGSSSSYVTIISKM